MSKQPSEQQSRLIGVLREGVSLVQMVFYKEVKDLLVKHYPEKDIKTLLMLAGAMTNELFGTPNPNPKFVAFRQEHRTLIEDELGSLTANLPQLCPYVTDALRVQTLCDNQEGTEDPGVLQTAESLGILVTDRNVPLPSAFMTLVRGLGEQYQLIIAPVKISPEDDQSLAN